MFECAYFVVFSISSTTTNIITYSFLSSYCQGYDNADDDDSGEKSASYYSWDSSGTAETNFFVWPATKKWSNSSVLPITFAIPKFQNYRPKKALSWFQLLFFNLAKLSYSYCIRLSVVLQFKNDQNKIFQFRC